MSSKIVPITNRKPATGSPAAEWAQRKRWNPFNSFKLLAHVERWRHIQRGGDIPPPVLITVDPTNYCNHDCLWCNAEMVRTQRGNGLSEKTLLSLADFLPRWGEGNGVWKPGVESICVAGGGEPLSNRATPAFIERAAGNGVEVGVVTNGSYIGRSMEALAQCTWVGVSVDAGTSATFNDLKRMPEKSGSFEQIIDNMAKLIDYSRSNNTRLGMDRPAYGVSYKYLLHKGNIGEVYEAARLAKEIGCSNIHFRPAGTTWDKLGTEEEIGFDADDIKLFQEQIEAAAELDDGKFGVYGVTHKFNSQFGRSNDFESCFAVFMTAVIQPPTSPAAHEDSFVVGLCCDRRGDEKLELATNIVDVEEINRLWGSDRHWRIHDRINVSSECPRCTYQPHNQIYEQVIVEDSMTYRFI